MVEILPPDIRRTLFLRHSAPFVCKPLARLGCVGYMFKSAAWTDSNVKLDKTLNIHNYSTFSILGYLWADCQLLRAARAAKHSGHLNPD